DFLRGRDAVARLHQRGLVLLADDVHAQFDAFVADEYRRAGDELAHLVLALAAERAIERVLGLAASDLAHPCSPSIANAGALEPFIRNVTAGVPRSRHLPSRRARSGWTKPRRGHRAR